MISPPTIQLDERLGALASMLQDTRVVADIGADHGRLALFLLQQDPHRRVLLSDVSADSLSKARRLLEGSPYSARATFVVADGLSALEGTPPPDAIVIAGMGAKLMIRLLSQGRPWIRDSRLCLQANTDVDRLRDWLCTNGFCLEEERLVRAMGRYYVVLAARQGISPPYTDQELFIGPLLLAQKPPELLPYLRWRRDVLTHAMQGLEQSTLPKARKRLGQVCAQRRWVEEILQTMGET